MSDISLESVIYRPPTLVEMPAIEALRYEVLDKPLGLRPGRLSESDTDPRAIHMAAFVDCQVISTVRLDPEADELYLVHRMATHPEAQRRGIGRRVLNDAVAIAAIRGAKEILLFSRVESTGFYEKLGYRQVSRQVEYPDEDGIPNIRMKKRI